MATGNTYNANLLTSDGGKIVIGGEITYTDVTNQPASNANSITSGALPTATQLVSGTGGQASTTKTVTTYTSVAYDNSANDSTITVALSPDNTTYSTLTIITFKTFTGAVDGNITMVPVVVPAGWYLKLTVAHATIGVTTYA